MIAARSAPVLIIGAAVLLAADIALGLAGWLLATPPVTNRSPTEAEARPLPDFEGTIVPTGAAFDPSRNEALIRPVFFSSRRPFQAPEQKPESIPTAITADIVPLERILAGVLIKGGSRRALLRQPADMAGQWHDEGDEIDGWRLISVEPGRATLEADGKRISLELYALGEAPAP